MFLVFFWRGGGGVLVILVLLWDNFDKNAYFDIFFAYLKPKFGTRNCMRSYQQTFFGVRLKILIYFGGEIYFL